MQGTYTSNVATSSSDVVNVQTDATSHFGDECTFLETVVDSLDAVTVHGE